jgi:hypothetical protein
MSNETDKDSSEKTEERGVDRGKKASTPEQRAEWRAKKRRYVARKNSDVNEVHRMSLRALAHVILDIDAKSQTVGQDNDDRMFLLAVARDLGRIRNDKTRADSEAKALDDPEEKVK